MKNLKEFKTYLLSGKNKVSKITVKNYISDINKFIRWYEEHNKSAFRPGKVTPETIKVFKLHLSGRNTPPRSAGRYISSLKNFYRFLMEHKLISINPFDQITSSNATTIDPLLLKEFKLFLFSNKLSKVTTKNYIMDIKQFITYLRETNSPNVTDQNLAKIMGTIDQLILETYKNRLLNELHLSTASINRKLSSVRKYLSWLGNTNISNNLHQTAPALSAIPKNVFNNLRSQNTQKINENKINENSDTQITILDQLLALPITRIIENARYFLWKLKGKNIFKEYKVPIETHSSLNKSIKKLPLHLQFLYHIRHTRPKWYKIYHSYSFSSYIHLGILIICTTILGATVYSSVNGQIKEQGAAFASPAEPPPKTIMFQGQLTDAMDNPITAETQLRFALYNDQNSTGSALLWQDIQNISPDQDGKFTTTIGDNKPIASSIFSDNPSLFLGMTIGDNAELKPRQQLATVSLSGNSEKLQGLIPITQTNAGTSNVILALNSAGNLTIGGNASPTFEASGGQFTLSGRTLVLNSTSGSDTNIEISPDGSGFVDIQKPIQNTTNNNNLPSAIGAVEIDDMLAVLATSSGQSAFTINQNSTGQIISASSGGTAKFILENNGTGMFAGNLIINGNTITTSATTFNFLNNNVTNLSIADKATSISLGAATGMTKINNTIMANGGLTVPSKHSLIVSGNVASNLIPFVTGLYDLGSPAVHWNNAYIDNLFTTSTASVSGFWQKTNGAISPLYSNDDFIIGGTGTSAAKFQIYASGTNAGTASTSGQLSFTASSRLNILNNGTFGFYNSIGGDTGINTSGPALYISPLGSIGIGTNNPSAKLQVVGDIRSRNLNLESGGSVKFENNIGEQSAEIKTVDISGFGTSLLFSTKKSNASLTEKMRLDANGSLVLGAQSANAALDIHANSGTNAIALISGATSNSGLVVDNSGTGSILSASSSGITRFVITQSGNIGIADSNPANTLKILGSVCVKNTSGACSGNTPGTIYADNTHLQSADVAENYISSQNLEPGDIVMPEGKDNDQSIIKTPDAYQFRTIGIISTKPGITLNSDVKTDSEHPYLFPLALSGRVPVKVNTENGEIHAGDFITSSSIPGVGMKATRSGMVVGKALENYSVSDTRAINKIMIFVNPTFYNALADATGYNQEYNQKDNNSVISNIQAGLLQVNETITNSLKIATENITIGGQTMNEYITQLIQTTIKEQSQSAAQTQPSGSQSTSAESGTNNSIINPLASNISPTPTTALTITPTPTPANASSSADLISPAHLSQQTSTSAALLDNNPIKGDVISSSASASLAADAAKLQTSSDSARQATGSAITNPLSGAASQSAQTTNTPESSSAVNPDNYETIQLLNKNQKLSYDFADISSISGSLTNISSGSAAASSGVAQFPRGLMAYGPTTLSDTAIAGNLNIGGSLILANNSIDTLGNDLQIQPLRQGNISLMGNMVAIDTNGNLKVSGNAEFAKNVSVRGKLMAGVIAPVPDSDLILRLSNPSNPSNPSGSSRPSSLSVQNSSGSGVLAVNQTGDMTASGTGTFANLAAKGFNIIRGAQADTSLVETVASSSAGTAVVTAYETERTIISPFMKKDSLVYLTATSDTQGVTPYIARQTHESFTIALPYSISKNIKVNWWIIN